MAALATPWLAAPVVAVLLAASAFFSSTEIAVFSLPDRRAGAAEDDPRARALAGLRSDPHRLLVTLLVGNNLVNVALATVVTLAVADVLPAGQAAVVATLLASTLVLLFGEILPKAYGLGHAEGWALSAARPLVVVSALIAPVVMVFDVVTRRLSRLVGGTPAIERPYAD